MNDGEPTLIINRFDSRCGVCGKPANPYAKTHDEVLGWNQDDKGCGVEWTHVQSHYIGGDINTRIKLMRPDLKPKEVVLT